MKIKTKFRIMYYPMVCFTAPFVVFAILTYCAEWIAKSYKVWCWRKSKWLIRDERGHLIVNPELEEE